MAIFIPRTRQEILQELLAAVVAQSPLTDVSEGSVLATILGAAADQIEAVEFRLNRIVESFDFEAAVGTDLDERVGQLPGTVIERLDASPAAGACLRLQRNDPPYTGDIVVAAGTLFGRTDDPDISYILTNDFTLPDGQEYTPPQGEVTGFARVQCTTTGEVGNAQIGTIDRTFGTPFTIGIVDQAVPIEGQERETDAQLRNRVRLYLSSLARSQKAAMEFLARSYVAKDGTRLRHAHVYEDAQRPAYSEMVVDDGQGLGGLITTGQTTSGTVPFDGQTILWHQAPAVQPIAQINVDKGGGFTTYTINDLSGNPRWISLEERGVVLIIDPDFLQAGDDWVINTYDVYTGIIRELQALIEGDPSDPAQAPGWRAAGTRVKVTPPDVTYVTVTANLIVWDGADLEQLQIDVRSEILAWMGGLAPGEPFLRSQLCAHLLNVFEADLLRAVNFNAPLTDIAPSSDRHVVRADPTSTTVV